MNKTLIKFICLLSFLMMVTSTFAHERRLIGENGEYRLTVGFANEPAAEDEPNQLDMFLLYNDGSEDGEAVNKGAGDLVEVDFVKVLLLKKDSQDAEVLREAKLKGELRQRFGTSNRYNIHFRPTVDGAYGFWVKGRVQDLVPNEDADPGSSDQPAPKVEFEEIFVCEGGSLDIGENGEAQSRFSCVGDLQPFPAKRSGAKGGVDTLSYKDNDRFSLPNKD